MGEHVERQRKLTRRSIQNSDSLSIFRATSSTTTPTSTPSGPSESTQQPRLGHDFSRISIQPKLTVSQPNDPAEQEAEAVADQVMAGEAVQIDRSSGLALQGDWRETVSDWVGDLTDSRPNEAQLDAQEDAQAELEAFMSQTYSEANHHPTTGRGLFDVEYRPAQGAMKITVKLCFQFNSGDPTNRSWIASVGGNAAAAAYMPDQFVWQPGEADAWKENAIAQIESSWSDRYTFHSTRQYWEALPDVNVEIDIVEASARDAHFVTTVNKWPKDGGPLDAVTPPGSRANQSRAHFEESANNGITNPDVDHFTIGTGKRAAYGIVDTDNPGTIFFDLGRAEVSAADRARLRTFGTTLGRPEIPPFAVTLTGHASSEGTEDDNLRLSEDRARSVSNEIVGSGAKRQPTIVAEGERGADATAAWRKVEIAVGNFESDQTTVLHEFGHMLGLGDEYPESDATGSRTVGQRVAHSALAERLIPGQQPIVAHHDESIMANGEVIRPYHYVTFLEALGNLTDTVGQWEVGPGRHTPRGRGDFPVPSGHTGMG